MEQTDKVVRLAQFMAGTPDSRPEVAGMPVDVLKRRTDLQLAQVMDWVADNAHAQDVPERSTGSER